MNVSVAVIVIAVPAVINFSLNHVEIQSTCSNEIWLGFWGSYLGGIFTLIAFLASHAQQNKQFKISTQLQFFEMDRPTIESVRQEFEAMMTSYYIANFDAYKTNVTIEDYGESLLGFLAAFEIIYYNNTFYSRSNRDAIEAIRLELKEQCRHWNNRFSANEWTSHFKDFGDWQNSFELIVTSMINFSKICQDDFDKRL